LRELALNFETLTVQAVKCMSQRSLLWRWNDLAGGKRFPNLGDFQLDPRMHDPKALVIWSVERNGGSRTFRAKYQGHRIKQSFHDDWIGKTMDEVLPPATKQYAIDTANECAASGCAILSILATSDGAGRRIDCERLLLPFGKGSEVEHVVASLNLISLVGSYDEKTVMNNYQALSRVELVGRISSGFTKAPPMKAPGLVVELKNINGDVQDHFKRVAEV
jgi:hypothetical protein